MSASRHHLHFSVNRQIHFEYIDWFKIEWKSKLFISSIKSVQTENK